MRFELTTAENLYYVADDTSYVDKLKTLGFLFEDKKASSSFVMIKRAKVFVDLNTMEDLLKLQKYVDEDLILENNFSICIYDGFKE